MHRRHFLALAPLILAGTSMAQTPRAPIKAVLFDGLLIFDPRPVFARLEQAFPGRGKELASLWRTRLFEYTWLRTLMQRYTGFLDVAEASLEVACRSLQLQLDSSKRKEIAHAFSHLQAWPDVAPALQSLREQGIRLGLLTNFSPDMIANGLRRSGLEGMFEHALSTDLVQAYKPDPRAYQLGLAHFQLKKDEIAFAAFAGWDASGAKAFGYPSYLVNRLGAPEEALGTAHDGTGKEMADLLYWLGSAHS